MNSGRQRETHAAWSQIKLNAAYVDNWVIKMIYSSIMTCMWVTDIREDISWKSTRG